MFTSSMPLQFLMIFSYKTVMLHQNILCHLVIDIQWGYRLCMVFKTSIEQTKFGTNGKAQMQL